MSRRIDFFGVIVNLNKSLGRWEDDLTRMTLESRYAKAAQVHVRHSRDWIRTVCLDNPVDVKMINDQDAIKYLKNAMIVVEKYKPGTEENFPSICGAVDKALKCTYTIIHESTGRKGFITIGEPISYDKTLSSLPGDPDFPTDTKIGEPITSDKTLSSLPGDPDFPTDLPGDSDFPTETEDD